MHNYLWPDIEYRQQQDTMIYFYMDISNLIIYSILNKTILWLRCLDELILVYSFHVPMFICLKRLTTDVNILNVLQGSWNKSQITNVITFKIQLFFQKTVGLVPPTFENIIFKIAVEFLPTLQNSITFTMTIFFPKAILDFSHQHLQISNVTSL